MKLRYLIPSFIALVAMFVSCSENNDPTYLDEVKLSSSYVAIPQEGGQTAIKVTATSDWQLEKVFAVTTKNANNENVTNYYETPAWLKVSKVSGAAGETELTFSAEKTLDGRTCELLLTCGGKTQRINVIQGLSAVSDASVKEVLEGIMGKTYRVKGTISAWYSNYEQYGNMYITDETGTLLIYGMADKNGTLKNYPVKSWGLEIGDEITVEGILGEYKGTPQLVDVILVKLNKSLIKVDELKIGDEVSDGKLPTEGGEVTAYITCKGNGVSVEIPEDAKNWISISSVNPNSVTFRVLPNEGDFRKTTITFSTSDGKKNYTAQTVISQEPKPDVPGSEAKPFTVAEAIAKCKEIGSTASEQLYFAKGKISSIKEVSTSYGNATFNISDDGQDANFITCYRANSIGGAKFTSEDEISVGDEVLICGKLVNYNNETPQFAQGCYIVSIKKGNAPGSLAKPFTPAEANAFCQTLDAGSVTEDDYYVKGKIIEITDNNQFNTKYGNCTFYISADGTDSSDKFYVYRTLYLGNVKYSDDSWEKPKAGDEVVICGKLMLYKDKEGNLVPETSANNSYIYSIK